MNIVFLDKSMNGCNIFAVAIFTEECLFRQFENENNFLIKCNDISYLAFSIFIVSALSGFKSHKYFYCQLQFLFFMCKLETLMMEKNVLVNGLIYRILSPVLLKRNFCLI